MGGQVVVRVERSGDEAVLFAGDRPILTFGPEDAIAARDTSAADTAERAAVRVREALAKEQSRSAALLTLLSIALVVLAGMVALFFARKIGQLEARARAFSPKEHPERIPAIRLQSIEVVRPESLRAALLIATAASRVLLRLGIVYGWVLIGLSLFEPTRAYAEQLSGFVFGPLYALLARLIGSLPLLAVAAIAAIALIVLVRFVGLFFEGVARGQTNLDWLPADLAAPTSILVRSAVVIGFFVVAAPLAAGDDDGALARAGTVVVAALGLSTTPLLASAAVGAVVVYGRRISVGDWVKWAGRRAACGRCGCSRSSSRARTASCACRTCARSCGRRVSSARSCPFAPVFRSPLRHCVTTRRVSSCSPPRPRWANGRRSRSPRSTPRGRIIG